MDKVCLWWNLILADLDLNDYVLSVRLRPPSSGDIDKHVWSMAAKEWSRNNLAH